MKSQKNARKSVDDLPFVQAIRRGLVMLIPLLMIGSFALIFNVFPVDFYQEFITTFAGGFLSRFFVLVNEVTFGILGLCITISISASYLRQYTSQTSVVMGASIASLCSFLILNGFFTDSFVITSFGAQGMFTAIFSACFSSAIYKWLIQRPLFSMRLYTVGANVDFNNSISVIVPVAIVVCIAFFFNQGIIWIFGGTGFEDLFHTGMNAFFNLFQSNTFKSLLFVMFTNLFWFFGIHGSNVLESVAVNIFADGAMQGSNAVADFLTKPVIDVFVLMGGCGTTISLLVAILLFSKQKNDRNLAKMTAFPMLFNINELMVFGLPIVFNSSFFIPFLLTPLVCIGTSWAALSLGIVPYPIHAVEWVTPVILNGYQATGSIAGSLLQIFNIAVGALIYRYFLLRYEKKTSERVMQDLSSLIDMMHESENSLRPLVLLELRGNEGGVAKMLATDLQHVLKNPGSFALFYQPQYNNLNKMIGAEALLRWNHPQYGMIYPPLVIQIAQETDSLMELEFIVFTLACQDITAMSKAGLPPKKISVNVTTQTLQDSAFYDHLCALLEKHPAARNALCIEVTEQMSFLLGDAMKARLKAIQDLGIEFAVDDFSMGHTSVKYLQSNLFSLVKLDGSLVADMMENPRSEEIIASIVHMSGNMHFKVLAEFVETKEERQKLQELGVYLYQGYLFSPAVPLDKFLPLALSQENQGTSAAS